jgi:cytochrome P450
LPASAAKAGPITRLSARDTAGVMLDVVAPLFAQGVIVRRPAVVAAAARLGADRRAVLRMGALRDRYGPGPVLLRLPARDVALVLSSADVHRVLVTEPELFAPANREKRAALSHFQPEGVLISEGRERAARRAFNEDVLESERPTHSLGDELVARAREEAHEIIGAARRAGQLTWDVFAPGWWRLVRRVVLGDGARDDEHVTDALTRLRRDANWAFLKPRRTRLREQVHTELSERLARLEPRSLAARIASGPGSGERAAVDQVAHWLFAFDAAAMAAFRTLALLDAHPSRRERVRNDPALLRAAVLESVRLWPTTPAVLRDATAETNWTSGTLPKGSAVVIFAPFFHRDRRRLPYADAFCPEIWLDGRAQDDPALIPFSDGPAICPGRNLVLLLTSSVLSALVEGDDVRQASAGPLHEGRPLPATLNPFGLRFALDHPGTPVRRSHGDAEAEAGGPQERQEGAVGSRAEEVDLEASEEDAYGARP